MKRSKVAYPCGFRYTFCHHLFVALLVTCISTVLALVSSSIEKELAAECTKNDLVKLFLNEFMAIHFMHFALALTNSALPTETAGIQRPLANILLH